MLDCADKTEPISILFICKDNIQSQFVERELNNLPNTHVIRKNLTPPSVTHEDFDDYSVALISYKMPTIQALIRELARRSQSTDLIVYDVPDSITEPDIKKLKNLKGCLYESAPVEHLSKCVKAVSEGEYWLPRKLMSTLISVYKPLAYQVLESSQMKLLSQREIEILQLLAKRKTNGQIAELLFLAESTVKTHLYRIYKKISVKNRREAIAKINYHVLQ
ncbi:response regulator transcription factor [Alteromonas ponticola]|uniref:Response regulator transcription factor n=1 Tax=Alteromonas ponticola TaxID=2720613 RepID=A0ABX1R1Y6_9ALTE|nr:response regulator transcription factor [Alteromonas ponticola]NMH60465.1 response regulator transcription factor [Alteromonas ponticola]